MGRNAMPHFFPTHGVDMKVIVLVLITLGLASVGPLIFPAAQSGHGNLSVLASHFLVPTVVLLGAIAVSLRNSHAWLSRAIVVGALAGAVATIALEVVRLFGFHLGYMPGNLPRLMGVLILDRLAQGPSFISDLAGFAYHFWNGASFGIIYVLLLGTRRRWLGTMFGLAIGLGFLVSPVVLSLGVGYFGLEFSRGFPVTVVLAHLAFGTALGSLTYRFLGPQPDRLLSSVRAGHCSSCSVASPAYPHRIR
jgi:hypothetical protein